MMNQKKIDTAKMSNNVINLDCWQEHGPFHDFIVMMRQSASIRNKAQIVWKTMQVEGWSLALPIQSAFENKTILRLENEDQAIPFIDEILNGVPMADAKTKMEDIETIYDGDNLHCVAIENELQVPTFLNDTDEPQTRDDLKDAFAPIQPAPPSHQPSDFAVESAGDKDLNQNSNKCQLQVLAIACEDNEGNKAVPGEESTTQHKISTEEECIRGEDGINKRFSNLNEESKANLPSGSPSTIKSPQISSRKNAAEKIAEARRALKSPPTPINKVARLTPRSRKTKKNCKKSEEKSDTKGISRKTPSRRSSPRLQKNSDTAAIAEANKNIRLYTPPCPLVKKVHNSKAKASNKRKNRAEAQAIAQRIMHGEAAEEKIRKQVFENAFRANPKDVQSRYLNLNIALTFSPNCNDKSATAEEMKNSSCLQESRTKDSDSSRGSVRPLKKEAKPQKQSKEQINPRRPNERLKRKLSFDANNSKVQSNQAGKNNLPHATGNKSMPSVKSQEASKKKSRIEKLGDASNSSLATLNPEDITACNGVTFQYQAQDILVCRNNEKSVSKHPGNLAFLRFLLLSFATFASYHPNVRTIAIAMLNHWVQSNSNVRFLERMIFCNDNQRVEAWKPMSALAAVDITVVILRKIQSNFQHKIVVLER